MSKKILFIIGSMRKNSFNRQLAAVAEDLLGDRAEVCYLEYADLPYMNQDIEFPAPAAVKRVREQVQEADGLWIFTPEYNYQVPGVLKNLLDWLSRPLVAGERSNTVVIGKAVTISGAGGRSATAGSRKQLGELLGTLRMTVMKENETGISLPAEAFTTGRYEMSEQDKARLEAQADAFLDFLK